MQAVVEVSLKLLLAPLLIWQGLRVRKHALILPEATGPRSGVSGTGPLLRLLILGDSSAAGVGVETQDDALLGQLVARLSTSYEVHWQLIAKTGATTSDTFTKVEKRRDVSCDVAVVALGVNDVTRSVPLKRWLTLTKSLFGVLQTNFGAKHIYTSALPPMGAFPVLPQPVRWIMGLTVDRYDAAMTAYQAKHPNVTRIRFDLPLDPKLMASDGYHPSAQAYGIWADLLATEIRKDFEQVSGGKHAVQTPSWRHDT